MPLFDPNALPGDNPFQFMTFTPDPGGQTQSLAYTDTDYTAADTFTGLAANLRDYKALLGPFTVTVTDNSAGNAVLTIEGLPLPLPDTFTGPAAAAIITGTVNGLAYDVLVPIILSNGAVGVRLRVLTQAGGPFTDNPLGVLYSGEYVYLSLSLTDQATNTAINLTDTDTISGVEMALAIAGEPAQSDWVTGAVYTQAAGKTGVFVGAALPAVWGAYFVWARVSFAGGGQVVARAPIPLYTEG